MSQIGKATVYRERSHGCPSCLVLGKTGIWFIILQLALLYGIMGILKCADSAFQFALIYMKLQAIDHIKMRNRKYFFLVGVQPVSRLPNR